MKKPYSKTLLRSQNGVRIKLKKHLIAWLSGVFSSVDPERFRWRGISPCQESKCKRLA